MLKFNDTNFEEEVLKHKGVAVVEFKTQWCTVCRKVTPLLEEVSEEYSEKIKSGQVDAGENIKIAMDFGVVSVPQVLIFKSGKVLDRIIGVFGKETIKKKIKEAIK